MGTPASIFGDTPEPKPAFFVGSAREDLRQMPKPVRDAFGQAIFDAQRGGKALKAQPLQGYRGAGVLEVIEDHKGSTYRAVYTVRLAGVVYVLHVFQEKSRHGIETSAQDLELIRDRLRWAEEHHAKEMVGRRG